MKLAIFTVLMLVTLTSAFAQVDSSSLRLKYGDPLNRETFTVRPGIEMIVDYGPNKQVCRLRLPSGEVYGGTVPDSAITKQKIDQVLDEVVPLSIRGRELNRLLTATGALSVTTVVYEHVTISELKVGGEGKGITISFKDWVCRAGQ